jgi:CSLREA domain-containing protein
MRTTIYSSVSHKLLSALVLTALVLAALPVMPAFAAGISVTTTTDEYTAAGSLCSLREAIVLTNNNAPHANDCTRGGVGNDDIITLQSGLTYGLSLAGAGGANVGDLDIGNAAGTSGNLTIQASGSTPAIIDAADIDRVLDVDAAGNYSLTLINIIVTNGNTTAQPTTTGGGISFAGTGTLTLINSTVSNNVATNAAGCGAGIYNNSAATVVITNSTIDGNTC